MGTPTTIIPRLDLLMAEKGATVPQLSLFASVSKSVIERARRGRKVTKETAEKLIKALATRVFPQQHTKHKMMQLPQNKYHNSITVAPSYMKNFPAEYDPDNSHTIACKNDFVHRIPIDKTEEEIERQYQYNQIMGRRK